MAQQQNPFYVSIEKMSIPIFPFWVVCFVLFAAGFNDDDGDEHELVIDPDMEGYEADLPPAAAADDEVLAEG